MALPITGYALINALGGTREAQVSGLREGASGLRPATIALPFSTFTGAIDTALPSLPGALAAWTTRSAQLASLLIEQLSDELARARARWRPERIAIILGTSTAGADRTEDAYKHFIAEGALPEDYDLWRHHTYGALLHVVAELTGARGPAWMLSTACTSSAKPFATAQRLINAGVIDAAIVGGLDTLCSMTLSGFHALGALDEELTRPFAAGRRGINIGEGGAFLLIERTGDARALLEAVGESSDAYHIAAPHPEGAGAKLAMERALHGAGLAAADVDHVNAHGTGTPLNDSAEGKAISEVFGNEIPVTSTKGYTGHTLGGAGATEAAFAILCLEERFVPASLGADPADPALDINVTGQRIDGALTRVLSNSFAFGGNNVSVILRSI